uniref:Uncharacterized protein n=1 Tax=Tanacetum cinerariifolium TaxID=118510 RepID=A0A6L2KYE6_TANCI|nr:hypothetical protein [Tanacetum cinerariifolium]
MNSIEKCIIERANHEQVLQKRLNERKLQIQWCTFQEVKALDAILEDNAKKRCMVSLRQLHSHLKHLSQNELQGSQTESGFKHAFVTIFGQDLETFTSIMFLNVEQLEKQLDKEDFQELGSMAAFNKSIDERAHHKREYETRVNERQMQITEEKDTSIRSGNDAHDDDADIRPKYDEEPMAEEREASSAESHHMIASSNSRISSKNMPRFSSNDMVHNHYLEEAKKKTQERNRNLEPSLIPSARSQSTADGSKPKPRINNQTSRNWPASKSSCVMTKPMPIAEHSRNFSDSKHFVCSTCQQCVFSANHDSCFAKFLNKVNSRAKVPSNKTTNRNKPVEQISVPNKQERQIPTGHGWKPTGRIFKTVGLRWVPTGKIFASSTTKVDSEPLNGSNADITNQYECEQTLDVNAVLRYDGDECDKRIMPTKIELTLEQSQQGASNDVLVSIEGVEELKRNVWIKGENKAALHYTLEHPSDTYVFTVKMEILLEPTSNKLLADRFCESNSMVGGRKDGPIASISSNNVFAALSSSKKKKKSSKNNEGEGEKVFWAPAPLTMKSWADVDDEDDDDYYATTAPPVSAWAGEEEKPKGAESAVEESESEDEGLGETDDEENDHEPEAPYEEPVILKAPEVLPPKDTDRQLSKKELKKKELAELEAVLAELGLNESSGKENSDAAQEKVENQNGGAEKKDKLMGTCESKSAKKKKKEKLSKDVKEQSVPNEAETDKPAAEDKDKAEDLSGVDMKEKLKKMASMKKKKSSKEMDGAARAAASEAAARSARLAAAKKKEKNHYNQQPVRPCTVHNASGVGRIKPDDDIRSGKDLKNRSRMDLSPEGVKSPYLKYKNGRG